jgi:hypothetical protein
MLVAFVTFTTSTGVVALFVLPVPSWPKMFHPQHFAPPAVICAQLWYLPPVTELAPDVRPTTSTGKKRSAVVPSPTWPKSLRPQHFTPPLDVTAQV